MDDAVVAAVGEAVVDGRTMFGSDFIELMGEITAGEADMSDEELPGLVWAPGAPFIGCKPAKGSSGTYRTGWTGRGCCCCC
jgi:hypothetical protein